MAEGKAAAAAKRAERQNELAELERLEKRRIEQLNEKRKRKKELKKAKSEKQNKRLLDWLDRTDRMIYPFAAALCTGIIIFYVYILGRSGSVIMNSDLKGQYYDFLLGYRRILLGGGSLSYSFDMGMGLGLVGSFAYYLMSPFNLLVLLFPADDMISVISWIIVLKISSMALAFAFYARIVLRRKGMESVIFSIAYALCGFVLSYFFHLMWLDALILLPVACIQIHRFIAGGKKSGLIFSLFLLFLTNFYMGYIVFACLFLYFLAYGIFVYRKKDIKTFAKKILQFLGSALLALSMSAFLIVPAVSQLQDRLGSALGKNFFADMFQSDIFTISRQCFIRLYEEYSDGQPLLYTGIITVVVVFFYFCNKKISGKERRISAALLLVMACIMVFRPLSLLMYAGSRNRFFEYRYAFFVSFLLVAMACRQFPYMRETGKKKICIFFAAAAAFLIGYYLFATRLASQLSLSYLKEMGNHFAMESASELYLNLFFLLACAAVLVLLHKRKISFRNFSVIMLFLLITEVSFVGSVIIHNRRTTGVSETVSDLKAMRNASAVMERLIDSLPQDDFYRVEKNFDITENSCFGLGYKGMGIFTSVQYQGLDELAKKLGIKAANSTLYHAGSTDITNALFGIRYTLHFSSDIYETDTLPDGDTLLNMMYLKKEENTLPLGFMVDREAEKLSLEKESLNPFENQEAVLSAMLGGEQVKCYKPCEADAPSLMGLEKGREEGNKIIYDWSDDAGETAVIKYKIPMKYGHGKYYFYTTQNVSGEADGQEAQEIQYYDNGYGEAYKDYVYSAKEGYQKLPSVVNLTGDLEKINWEDMQYVYLGENGNLQKEKDNLSLSLIIKGSERTVLQKPFFYYFDSAAFQAVCDRLKTHPLRIEEFRDGYIRGKVEVEDAKLLYTSIPYEKGWKVRIDGKEGEPVPILEQAFLGVELTEGKHEIELIYETPRAKTGACISMAGVICFIVICFMENYRKRRQNHGQEEQ